MDEILQLKINGIKNIEKEVTINFVNTIVDSGIKNISRVKGIFGYNGSGKTALINALDIYKNIMTSTNYLNQIDVIEELSKLINLNTKQFSLSILFKYKENQILKHSILLGFDDLSDSYNLKKEEISLLNDRSINGKYKTILLIENGKLSSIDEDYNSSFLDELKANDFATTSIVPFAARKISSERHSNDGEVKLESIKYLLLRLYFISRNINVYMKQSDNHRSYGLTMMNLVSSLKKDDSGFQDYLTNLPYAYTDEVTIPAKMIDLYEKENTKLERFIKYFKPELESIELIKREDKDQIHLRRLFKYKSYNVEYEFESSGIKELVNLFSYLSLCANGGIAFIDEMDANLNSAYFSTLISFFVKYGKGQLVFTTHNLEAMNALKPVSKSILVLGVDGNIDTWIGKGNRSPIKDYLSGNLPHSPMNIEDFDFINLFSLN